MITELNDNPTRFPALEQARHIVRLLESGLTERDLAREFAGDSPLVRMWLNFLTNNGWIRLILNDQKKRFWTTTDKGREWLEAILHQHE